MGAACTHCSNPLVDQDVPNLTRRINLYEKQINKQKLCIIKFIPIQSSSYASLQTQIFHSCNLKTIYVQYELKNKRQLCETTFKQSLQDAFDNVVILLNSKKSAIYDTILIEEPSVKPAQCYLKMLRFVLEKLDGLNGELEHLDLSVRVEIPWGRISTNKKCELIKHIKMNRLYKSMDFTVNHHEANSIEKESKSSMKKQSQS